MVIYIYDKYVTYAMMYTAQRSGIRPDYSTSGGFGGILSLILLRILSPGDLLFSISFSLSVKECYDTRKPCTANGLLIYYSLSMTLDQEADFS